MSGTHITDRQVHLYMTKRKDHTQEVAAAKAGMSVRTARRVTKATELPSQKPERDWRTRTNPFADVWDSEIVPLLRCSPKLKAITLLRKLQEDHADRFPTACVAPLNGISANGARSKDPARRCSSSNLPARRARAVGLHAHGETGCNDRRCCVRTFALSLCAGVLALGIRQRR